MVEFIDDNWGSDNPAVVEFVDDIRGSDRPTVSEQIDDDKKSDSPVLTGADSVNDNRGSNVLQP